MSEAHEARAEKKSGILAIALNLTVACIVSGVILAVAYFITHPVAVQKQKEADALALQTLVPAATSFVPVDGQDNMTVAKNGDTVVAYVVEEAPRGYESAVEMLVAVSSDGKVLNFSITSNKETPGLGTKASEPAFMDQFIGKTSEHLAVTKDPANKEDVQAITGATITSKAVTKGVKAAVDEVAAYTGGK
ncbi:electron transport complex protein RnfG [Sporobacter termitidis DSM 10068]|uniref:Ion-translocating oxidoreductase complex subunit G n=1 Tax=Sporobacter termitidis DSM 10068 TaxID=1123282 RepID=A0A1M5UII2_9FIRM|nr:FMN-binding protein [Sporobacter termitidis]SHH62731.1 electron transport complex protein RnfG [Sporobacter termitidis DSM 10068]